MFLAHCFVILSTSSSCVRFDEKKKIIYSFPMLPSKNLDCSFEVGLFFSQPLQIMVFFSLSCVLA